jgi:hypothetical protein
MDKSCYSQRKKEEEKQVGKKLKGERKKKPPENQIDPARVEAHPLLAICMVQSP